MNQTQIKQQLLENYSNKVLDVEFLDKYLCLCFSNIDTKRVKRVTERHHILPRAIFPKLTDHPNNIVNLTLLDHIKAHYYLYKAFGNKHSIHAFKRVICQVNSEWVNLHDTYSDDELKVLAELIEKAKNAYRDYMNSDKNHHLGTKWSDERRAKFAETYKTSERIAERKKALRNRRWYHKDDVEVFCLPEEVEKYLAEGYVKGRSKSSGEKGSKTRTGRHHSQEHKDKIRNAMLALGDKHHMKQEKGRKWAKEVGVYHIHPEMLQENK